MENYRKSAHCTYDIKYHIVWITKYGETSSDGPDSAKNKRINPKSMSNQ